MSSKRAVCLLSGGLDSAVVSAIARIEGQDLYTLTADYGQVTRKKELDCAQKLAQFYQARKAVVLDLTWLRHFGASGLTDPTIYLSAQNARLEYVPFRNTVLLSAAVAWAEAIEADYVYIGSTGPPWNTPDNRPEYFKAMQEVVRLGTQLKTDILIRSPLDHSKKHEVINRGIELGVPFWLTWSCHNREDRACGDCSNCKDRRQAFVSLGMIDPIPYVV